MRPLPHFLFALQLAYFYTGIAWGLAASSVVPNLWVGFHAELSWGVAVVWLLRIWIWPNLIAPIVYR